MGRGVRGGYSEILGDPLGRRCVEGVGGGRVDGNHWAVYGPLKALAFFCRVNGISPSELVERLKNGGDSRELWERFLMALKQRGCTGVTVKRYLVGLRGFLDYYNVIDRVNWNYVNRLKRRIFGKGLSKNVYARREGELTKPLIRRILIESCKSNRDRAFVLLLATSGISFGDALALRVGDIENLWFEQDCYMIQYVRRKTGVKATTFITRECRDWIVRYLEERKGKGEVITPDSPLFANSTCTGPLRRTRAIFMMRRIFDNAGLTETIGVDARGKKRYKYHTHLFRKYFRTALRNAGVDRIYVEAMMGHDIHSMFGVEMVYDKQADKPDVLREQYRRALHELTFLEESESQAGVSIEDLEYILQRIKELEAKFEIMNMLDRNIMQNISRNNSGRRRRKR
ncbi:MAG: hypothetical protein DRJ38_08205 [Thermoprotei archaeon]|nr:MAG: hypothetical protein DRJ38_08205 [Thermoprotei archaeon]